MPRPTTHYLAEIETTVAGIPCIVAVTDYEDYVPAAVSGPPENCYPAEGGFGEYHILDRKGYRALWLERKVTGRVDREIQDDIYNHFEG